MRKCNCVLMQGLRPMRVIVRASAEPKRDWPKNIRVAGSSKHPQQAFNIGRFLERSVIFAPVGQPTLDPRSASSIEQIRKELCIKPQAFDGIRADAMELLQNVC